MTSPNYGLKTRSPHADANAQQFTKYQSFCMMKTSAKTMPRLKQYLGFPPKIVKLNNRFCLPICCKLQC